MKDISKEIQNFKIFKNNKFQISNLKIINLFFCKKFVAYLMKFYSQFKIFHNNSNGEVQHLTPVN